ncbi:MAG: hypothetical protein NVS3B21_07420 [Acidimicrobiales bacterium]
MSRTSDTAELRARDRVIAVAPVGIVPEGSQGTIKLVVGQAWTRYWVAFDNGHWVNGVDPKQVVRLDRYEDWKTQQAAAAERAARPVPAAAALPEGGGAAAPAGAGSGIPEHLLERSRLARERKAAAAAG